MTLKNNYSKLQKKYSLPELSKLNREFKIEEIDEETEILLIKIRKKMTEKIGDYCKLIESILQPDSNLASLYETHHVSDRDRKDAYNLFKRMMTILRESELVGLHNKEEDNARFIKTTYEEWNKIKQRLETHINRIIKMWKKETDMASDLSYFG